MQLPTPTWLSLRMVVVGAVGVAVVVVVADVVVVDGAGDNQLARPIRWTAGSQLAAERRRSTHLSLGSALAARRAAFIIW